VPVNSTHADYDAIAADWIRARDVIAGEDAVKAAGQKYLPRLDCQTEEEYAAYRDRAAFFNATARTGEGYVGLIFRRAPFVKGPDEASGVGRALADFSNDADMLGTSLYGYAKNVVTEVIAVGRAGTLVDWEGEFEQRVYASLYAAEQIINWKVCRVNGRSVPVMVALREQAERVKGAASGDEYAQELVEQIRVLKLVDASSLKGGTAGQGEGVPVVPSASGIELGCLVEIWQPKPTPPGRAVQPGKVEWELVETRVPLRLGKPLPRIPFVFHGVRHSRPDIGKVPLGDIIAVNLDHYRLDADYKHGLHFTALPTAWVSGFDKTATLRIGSSTAWVSETPGASAGFLEFHGQGLQTFERAMDRCERLMTLLGSRLLESQKKAVETARSIALRQTGENSILASIATSVSESLTQVLRWAYWWNSTEAIPEDVTDTQALVELNTNYDAAGMASDELAAVVGAWQAGAISQDSMFELFRKGEVLPDGRTNERESQLVAAERPPAPPAPEPAKAALPEAAAVATADAHKPVVAAPIG